MSFLDLTNVEAPSFDPIPGGMYRTQVDKAEVMETKKGGQMLILVFKILEGKFENRTFRGSYNIKNENEEAQNIALGKIKNLLEASGKPSKLESINDIVGAECMTKTRQTKDKKDASKIYSEPVYFKPTEDDETEALFS